LISINTAVPPSDSINAHSRRDLPCEYSNLSRRQPVKSQQEQSGAEPLSPAENASGGSAVVYPRAGIASSWLSKLSATAIAQPGGRHGGVPAWAHSDRMHAQAAARIAAFLDAHHVMSLATSGRDGPHAASLFYALELPVTGAAPRRVVTDWPTFG
jgi:hypothetical protein